MKLLTRPGARHSISLWCILSKSFAKVSQFSLFCFTYWRCVAEGALKKEMLDVNTRHNLPGSRLMKWSKQMAQTRTKIQNGVHVALIGMQNRRKSSWISTKVNQWLRRAVNMRSQAQGWGSLSKAQSKSVVVKKKKMMKTHMFELKAKF